MIALFKDSEERFEIERPPETYNVSPGCKPLVIHQLDGKPVLTRWHWGYVPMWGDQNTASPTASLDSIKDGSRCWSGPLKHQRMIIPVEGWYEFIGPNTNQQPWLIRPLDWGKPLWLAAISGWQPGIPWNQSGNTTGFAIVIDESYGGMVDDIGSRPIVLNTENARLWLDPSNNEELAEHLLVTARQELELECYPVTQRVTNPLYQGDDASEPI